VTGAPGAPAGITAVALNVTAIFPESNGYVTVYPCGADRPFASSLNPVFGKVKPNLVIVPVSASGTVCVYSLTEVDVVVDVVGYVSSTTTAKLTPTTPFRFTDTRDMFQIEMNAGNNGLRLAAGQVMVVPMAGQRGIPANAKSISANLTATDALGPGFLTAWSCGSLPIASNVNYDAGGAVANAASLPLSSAGEICIYSSESVHVIIDVNGWWS
jgi:hypothetical protein